MIEINDKPAMGRRIKEEREAKGYSQAELGRLCGWADEKDPQRAQSRISNYETEARSTRVNPQDVQKIADALGVSAAWLLFGRPYEKHGGIRKISEDRLKVHQVIESLNQAELVLLQLYLNKLLALREGPDTNSDEANIK